MNSDVVKLVVRIPRESYENMKKKAQSADISVNKFLNRAGSVVTVDQVVNPPGYTGGAVSVMEYQNQRNK